jgi:sugar lactone lactonase YvrE
MMKRVWFLILVVLLFTPGCVLAGGRAAEESLPAGTAGEEEPPAGEVTEVEPVAEPAIEPEVQPEAGPAAASPADAGHSGGGSLWRQWGVLADSDLLSSEPEAALGRPNATACEDPLHSWYDYQPETTSGEYYLRLDYEVPVLASSVNIIFSGNSGGTLRAEALDSRTGLGGLIFQGPMDPPDECPGELSIPVDLSGTIDTVILTFSSEFPPVYVDAVELVGELPGYLDLPVYWRIPLEHDSLGSIDGRPPGGLAVDPRMQIFLANGHHGLLRFDLEGNLLESYPVPSESYLKDVALGPDGRIVVVDLTYQWFITLSQSGEQLNAGGEDFSIYSPTEVAVCPQTGEVYLLDVDDEAARIRVYDGETTEWLRDLPLNPPGFAAYRGLTFGADGFLYLLDMLNPAVLMLDPLTGEEMNAFGYFDLAGTAPMDLAVDGYGNYFVLLNSSRDRSAVYVLDPQGTLVARFGTLTYEGDDWGEGVFWFPVSIGVTPDGTFVVICENGYLTAYSLYR